MAASGMNDDLSEIKERLREGKITREDLARLEEIVKNAETAIGNLRAAVVE